MVKGQRERWSRKRRGEEVKIDENIAKKKKRIRGISEQGRRRGSGGGKDGVRGGKGEHVIKEEQRANESARERKM